MDCKHFYVTLFSNASRKIFPTNTHAAFTIQLAQAIDLVSPDMRKVRIWKFNYPPTQPGDLRPIELIGDKRLDLLRNNGTSGCRK